MTNQQSTEHVTRRQIPLNWKIPEGVHGIWVDNFYVQSTENDTITISFFQQKKPVLLGSPEEQLATLDALKSVDTVCVAQVVMPSSMAANIGGVIANILINLQEERQTQQGGSQ